jgi:hypothetical protein
LAVLWDFKGLQGSWGRLAFLQIFAAADCRRDEVDLARLEIGPCLTITRILIFRKDKIEYKFEPGRERRSKTHLTNAEAARESRPRWARFFANSQLRRRRETSAPYRHGRACPGHPRRRDANTSVDCHDLVKLYGETVANLFIYQSWTTWMAGTSPAMTAPIDSII